MSKATTALKKIVSRLSKTLDQAVSQKEMRALGEFTLDLIVKRTLLGYGVKENFGVKAKLKPLSTRYKAFRRTYSGLSGKTTATKSNLTLTGEMLDSMVIKGIKGKAVIQPSGRVLGRPSNLTIAQHQEEQGRIFNRVSRLEFQQLLRFYRKTFGDLLDKQRLLR